MSQRRSNKLAVPGNLEVYLNGTARIPSHTREIIPLQQKLRPLLKRAWPDASDKDISWLTADLAGLWEVSRWHVKLIRELLKTRPKGDKGKLQRISQELDVNWSNARSHLKTFERGLSRFKRSLYSEQGAGPSERDGKRGRRLKQRR